MSLKHDDYYCAISSLYGQFRAGREMAMLNARRFRALMECAEPGSFWFHYMRAMVNESVMTARVNNQQMIAQIGLLRRYRRSNNV